MTTALLAPLAALLLAQGTPGATPSPPPPAQAEPAQAEPAEQARSGRGGLSPEDQEVIRNLELLERLELLEKLELFDAAGDLDAPTGGGRPQP